MPPRKCRSQSGWHRANYIEEHHGKKCILPDNTARVLHNFDEHKRVASPNDQPPLHRLTNDQGYGVPIDCLTIAWHRPPNNLGDRLSSGNSTNARGWKYIPTLLGLESSKPLVFWAGTECLPMICPRLNKYFSLHIWTNSNCEGIPNPPWVSFFSRKRSLFWNPLFSVLFPPRPKIGFLYAQKLMCIRIFCIRLLQGKHVCCLTQKTAHTAITYLQKR